MVLKHFKNLLYLFTSKGLASFFAFFAQVLLARLLTQQDYGIVSFYIILINILSTLIGFGLGEFWLRRFAIEGNGAKKWIRPTIMTILLLVSVILPVYFLLPYFTIGEKALYISTVLLPLLLFQGFASITRASFQIRNQYTKLSYYMIVKNSILLISAVTLFIFNFSAFILSYGMLSLLIVVYSFFIIKNFNDSLPIEVYDSNRSVSQVLQKAWPYGTQGILYMLYYQVDIIIITILLGSISTGIYNAAYTILSLIFLLPSTLFQVYLLPKANNWIANKDLEKTIFIRKRLTLYFFILGLLITIIFYYMSGLIINELYGKEFLESTSILRALLLAVPFRFITGSLGVLFASKKMVSYKVYIQGSGALINIVLNVILISKIGVLGAAISTVVTEILVSILMYLFSGKVKKEICA